MNRLNTAATGGNRPIAPPWAGGDPFMPAASFDRSFYRTRLFWPATGPPIEPQPPG